MHWPCSHYFPRRRKVDPPIQTFPPRIFAWNRTPAVPLFQIFKFSAHLLHSHNFHDPLKGRSREDAAHPLLHHFSTSSLAGAICDQDLNLGSTGVVVLGGRSEASRLLLQNGSQLLEEIRVFWGADQMWSNGDGPPLGRELWPPPADGITNLRFSDHSDRLLVSSWDSKLRLYDVTTYALKAEFEFQGPVLDCCFHDDSSGYSACADHSLSRYDFNTNSETTLGSHDDAICSLEYSPGTGQVISGSWDKTLRCWDARSSSVSGSYVQPAQVMCMSLIGNRLVVATKRHHIMVYDIRKMSEAEQSTETHTRFQTRSVRCFPDGTGYAIGSTDGGVIVDWLNPSDPRFQMYSFKCHRSPEGGPKIFYPVNALAFHPQYGTLATGSGDRHVNVWDVHVRKRVFQYSKCPSSISSLAFNRDGHLLAVASSSTFEEGEESNGPHKIYVRKIGETEVKPIRTTAQ